MKRSLHLRSAGFTLLEIMLVVMIIALLAGSAIYMMGGNLEVANNVRIKGDMQTLSTPLMVYRSSNGFLPTTEQGLKALVSKPESSPKPRNWQKLMDSVPVDPYGMEYNYVQPGIHNPDSYDLFSAGKDRIAGTPDDKGNWESQ
jgi:general secretion pathway protein G